MLIPRVYARDFIPVSYSNVFELNYTPEQLIQIIIHPSGHTHLIHTIGLCFMNRQLHCD